MTRRNHDHNISETRDWARIILAAGVGVSLVILTCRGDDSAALLLSAIGWMRP